VEEGEISLEEFLQLPTERRQKGKVNYDAVLKEIEGRALTVSAIANIMLKHSENKKKVYYSEVTNWLERISKRGWEVLVRQGNVKYVLVRRPQ